LDAPARQSAPHPMIVALSGRTAAALASAAESLRSAVAGGVQRTTIADLSYTTTSRRDHHPERLAIVASSIEEVVAGLDEYLASESAGRAISGTVAAEEPRIAFVFSGQGSQWLGMGRELLDTAPEFRSVLERCDACLREIAGWSVLDVLRSEEI